MSWVGGKKALRGQILSRFPLEYKRYIEVFGGGGWVLFHKPPGRDFEVYNDFNGNLVNLYRCVREHPDELEKELTFMLNSRLDFEYMKYMLHAKSFLLTQGQTQQVVQAEAPAEAASPSAVGGISAALLAYGEKMNRLVDLAIFQALECHDQSTYIISPSELQDTAVRDPFDVELFIAMLKERPELVDMDVGDNGEVMVTLSLESIIEHDLSKMRVLTQDDVEIMYAKHILFNHDEGGEKADFSGCRLTNLDMRHMQLNGADFTGALLEDVRMNDAGLCFCTFRDAKLVGCNLNGAVAEESDFCGATFTECKLRNGIFTHSNFAHTSFQDTDLWMSDLRSCCIENSSIMDTETEGVNLSGTSEDEQGWVMGGM